MSLQFQNTETEIQIQNLHKDSALLEEEIMKNLNLEEIRMQAIERLGMQEAGRNTIIRTHVTQSDVVIANLEEPAADTGNDTLQQLETVLGNLEGFFKKIR